MQGVAHIDTNSGISRVSKNDGLIAKTKGIKRIVCKQLRQSIDDLGTAAGSGIGFPVNLNRRSDSGSVGRQGAGSALCLGASVGNQVSSAGSQVEPIPVVVDRGLERKPEKHGVVTVRQLMHTGIHGPAGAIDP